MNCLFMECYIEYFLTGWLRVTETAGSETSDKEELMYTKISPFLPWTWMIREDALILIGL